jgi:RNA polymerase sigma factor (sigma-70 family)
MSELALPSPAVAELPRAERLLSDELLARLVGRGNSRAFAALYERHHQALYRYCRSIVRDEHDAQDALQAAMAQAYAALAARERELSVRAWLFRIAHNESISLLRRRARDSPIGESADALGADLESAVETRARLAALLGDLRELPERQRGALVMRELSGLRLEEIAAALSISPAAAKQALFEARSSLRELAEGREMRCESVREALSARDGRVARARRIRSHLRACEDCRAFRAAIGTRESDLRLLAPAMPAPVAGAILSRLLESGGAHFGGGGLAAAGSSLGGGAGSGSSLLGHLGGSLLAKGLAGTAIVAAAAAGTARLANVGLAHHSPPRAAPALRGARPGSSGAGAGASQGQAGGAGSGANAGGGRATRAGATGGAGASGGAAGHLGAGAREAAGGRRGQDRLGAAPSGGARRGAVVTGSGHAPSARAHSRRPGERSGRAPSRRHSATQSHPAPQPASSGERTSHTPAAAGGERTTSTAQRETTPRSAGAAAPVAAPESTSG